jgi:lipopolysaccharide/colanic/teichoic acid biosynthesis glycosyltransferase
MTACADPGVHRAYMRRFIRNQAADPLPAGGLACYKLEHDERVTRVGRLLRRTSLDELPQLFNVLRGEMSLIGPRPAIPYEVEEYLEWHRARLVPRPGLTGLWQVNGRSRVTFDEMVRMDLDYAANVSLWMDVRILLRTPWAMLSGKGAS